ncbi:hypothetical protein B5728_13410 [Mammaliicoccus sciuri]|nr:hypothetical protein B5728_13410 [Mammaliicoccus sciuri]
MKILHIITSLESGGAERMLSNIVNYDDKNDHIIITIFKAKAHYEIKDSVKIINLNFKKNILNMVILIIKMKYIINVIKPDIIQTWMKSNYFAPILKFLNFKAKFILNFRHGVNNDYSTLRRYILMKYLNFSDGQIFVSNSSLREFESIGFKFKRSIVITNGFQNKKYSYKLNFDKELVLGYVGRFNSIKNQTFLVKEFDEFAKGKNVKLILAGRELEYEKFANYISDENKNKYTWLGETSNPFEVYNSIDALILTSNSEGFPNVIGEAMSIGVPVISTNAGESYQIIGDSGYKIENTKGSLTSKLNELNSNKQRLLLKSQLAYNRIQRCYLIEEKVNQYLNYYKKIYGGK